MQRTFRKFLVLVPSIAWLAFLFIVPLMIVFVYSFLQRGTYGNIEYIFTLNNYVHVLDPLYLKPVLRSIYVATLNTILCLLLGYPLAYFISNQPEYKKNFYLFLVMLPFWTNFLVRTYSWMIILRTEGLLNNLLIRLHLIQEPLTLLFTEKAVMLGLVYSYLPFMVLPLYASIEKLDHSFIDAAKDLGANPWKTFLKIILPLTRPGIISGSVIVFVPSMGAFIIPDLLGGAKNLMIGNLIKDQFLSARDWPFGSALSFLLMLVVLILLMIYIRMGMPDEASEKII